MTHLNFQLQVLCGTRSRNKGAASHPGRSTRTWALVLTWPFPGCVPGVVLCYSQLAASQPCSTQPRLLNFSPGQENLLLCILMKVTTTQGQPTGPSGQDTAASRRPEGQGCPPQSQPLSRGNKPWRKNLVSQLTP